MKIDIDFFFKVENIKKPLTWICVFRRCYTLRPTPRRDPHPHLVCPLTEWQSTLNSSSTTHLCNAQARLRASLWRRTVSLSPALWEAIFLMGSDFTQIKSNSKCYSRDVFKGLFSFFPGDLANWLQCNQESAQPQARLKGACVCHRIKGLPHGTSIWVSD